jgi:hypothetical protein
MIKPNVHHWRGRVAPEADRRTDILKKFGRRTFNWLPGSRTGN